MRTLVFVSIFAAALVSACAHFQDVRAGENGINRVSVHAEDQEKGSREAIAQANYYCDQWKQHAVFLNENQKYAGSMDEGTYNAAKRASKAAKVLGAGVTGAGAVQNQPGTMQAGGILGLGGAVTDTYLGKAYVVDMQFKCK